MRIVHVIRGLANSSGTTHIVNPLAEEQGRLGHEVRVLYVAKPPASALQPDQNLVRTLEFPLSLPFNNPGISWKLARALPLEAQRADVVHIHAVWNFPTWWAMRCANRAGKPFIVAPQGSFDPWALSQNAWGKKLYGHLTERPLLRRANRLQALSNKEARQFLSAGLNAKVEVIPNGIDACQLSETRQEGALASALGLPSRTRTLLFLSRVHEKKGLDLLLQAFSAIANQFQDVFVVVAGDDAGSGYRAQMQAMAASLGLADRCRFIGEVAGEQKRACLTGADAWALISRSEGLPVAAIEALGAGLPCVLSEECNLPEVADLHAGWTVPPQVEAAKNALSDLLQHPEEATRRATRGRNLVAERFTWERIAKRTIDVYRVMAEEMA